MKTTLYERLNPLLDHSELSEKQLWDKMHFDDAEALLKKHAISVLNFNIAHVENIDGKPFLRVRVTCDVPADGLEAGNVLKGMVEACDRVLSDKSEEGRE